MVAMMVTLCMLAIRSGLAWSVAHGPLEAASCAHCERTSIAMLAKKFKGGNLDDFLSAGEAEAKYGPQRYAAVYEDLRKLEVTRERGERERAYSKKVYEALKRQLLVDHAFLSLMLTAAVWSFFDLMVVRSFAVGAALGTLYLVLSQRSADSFGATSIEETKGGPPPLIVPVILVLLVAKNPGTFGFLPTFAGFSVERLATVAQAFYPADFGLAPSEIEGSDEL